MKIYSKTTEAFIRRALEDARLIINREVFPILNLSFQRSRIHYQNTNYPFTIVVFEDESRLGHCDYSRFEIGLSKKLMYRALDEVYLNILRHEILHYIINITTGPDIGHGPLFRDLGKKLNWHENVVSAKSNLELDNEKIVNPSEKNKDIIAKVKKLLSLASSDNKHESELATFKANQLIMDYNLSIHNQLSFDDEEVCVLSVLTFKKKNAKISAIGRILRHFYVSPIYSTNDGLGSLEVVGARLNVELAAYVAKFLDTELDFLYAREVKKNPFLKGLACKNSFFQGVGSGHDKKMEQLKSTHNREQKAGLILIEQSLEEQLHRVFPSLRTTYSKSKHNPYAAELGHVAGQNLHIRQGLNNSQSSTYLLE